MRYLFWYCLIIFHSSSQAQGVGEEEKLLELKSVEKRVFDFKKRRVREVSPRRNIIVRGNLGSSLVRTKRENSSKSGEAIVYPSLGPLNRSGLEVGDVLDCIIEQDIKAYSDSKSPVKATVIHGEHEGVDFIGNATMDPKTKNILVWFDLVQNRYENLRHKLSATVHSSSGELGLVGTHHSHYWRYFFASLMGRAAEGYAQASVQRSRNIFGGFEQVPTAENAGKMAIAEAASETADQATTKMKNTPEYTVVRGPIRVKIFVTKRPKLTD